MMTYREDGTYMRPRNLLGEQILLVQEKDLTIRGGIERIPRVSLFGGEI